jgi:hypothetical protein
MVCLAVPDIATSSGSEECSPHLPLRTTALWYPDIPPENLYLYESSFAGRDVPLSEYHPLVRVMFGGPRGAYLKYLTKISVTVSNAMIVGIDFDYESKGSPVDCLRACRSTMSADDSVKITFLIDGPGGEILTGMQVKGDYWLNSLEPGSFRTGAITSLEVGTLLFKKGGKHC